MDRQREQRKTAGKRRQRLNKRERTLSNDLLMTNDADRGNGQRDPYFPARRRMRYETLYACNSWVVVDGMLLGN